MSVGRKAVVTLLVLYFALTDSKMKCLNFSGPNCKRARDSGIQKNVDMNCMVQEKSCPESDNVPCACELFYLRDLNQSGYDKNNAPPSNHSFYGLLYADISYHFGKSPECQQKKCKMFSSNPLYVECCCNTHMCNADYHSIRQENAYVLTTTTLLNTTGTASANTTASAFARQENKSSETKTIALSCVAAACCVVVVMTSITIIVVRRKRRSREWESCLTISNTNRALNDFDYKDEVVELDIDPTLLSLISYGQFSKIYHGSFEGKKCVFKVTEMNQKSSWNREKYIYELPGLSHSHILQFFGVFKQRSLLSQYVLVLEYHSIGSLQPYLKSHTLSWETVLKVSQSMMSGLAYLHDELLLDNGLRKYPIAHRDFKSKNVLLKDDLTACIADFNLASELSNDQLTENVDIHMVGTTRYMAPELLDSAISFNQNAFLCIDVYAASLVLWEILSRCDLIPMSSYHLPYEEELGKDLDVNSLKLLVKAQNQRPAFSQILNTYQGPKALMTIIKEGWDEEPECRRTARNMEWQIEKLLKRTEIFV